MKHSRYNLCMSDPKGNYIIHNTRSGMVRRLTSDHYRLLQGAVNGDTSTAAAALVTDLFEAEMLVEDSLDERLEVESAHLEARKDRKHLKLVIAPSMACNLDCPYCFEKNKYAGTMSAEVQEHLITFVDRCFRGSTESLAVTWYGGEPLLGVRVIERLSMAFIELAEKHGRQYSASIITNGTALTQKIARLLANLRVSWAQITLDGPPDLHNKTRIGVSGKATFDRIINAVQIASEHMAVAVRINADVEVGNRLEELFEILADRGLQKKVSPYLAPVRDTGTQLVRLVQMSQGQTQSDLLNGSRTADLAVKFDDMSVKHGFGSQLKMPKPKCTTCIADQDHSFLIEPDGTVQKCFETAGDKGEAVGCLTSDGIVFNDRYRKWQAWSAFKEGGCRDCSMLPSCLGHCPVWHLREEPDHCPTFKHNWGEILSLHSREEEFTPVKLDLPGPNSRDFDFEQLVVDVQDKAYSKLKVVRYRCVSGAEIGHEHEGEHEVRRGTNALVLSGVGATIWAELGSGSPLGGVVDTIASQYPDVPQERVIGDVLHCVNKLRLGGFIEVARQA